MVVHDLDVFGTGGRPAKAHAELVVHPNAVLPSAVTLERFEPIPAPGEAIKAAAGKRLVGLDGSQFNRIDSHGGVANPYTAWALRTQMTL